MADEISKLPNGGNQNTTHKSNYITEKFPEIYDIAELLEGKFPIFNIIEWYQQNDPGIMDKLTTSKYKRGLFCGIRNKILTL